MLTTEYRAYVKETVSVLRDQHLALGSLFSHHLFQYNFPTDELTNSLKQQLDSYAENMMTALLIFAEYDSNLCPSADKHSRTPQIKHDPPDIDFNRYDHVEKSLIGSISILLGVPRHSKPIKSWQSTYTKFTHHLIK